jgi:hypothetical protein
MYLQAKKRKQAGASLHPHFAGRREKVRNFRGSKDESLDNAAQEHKFHAEPVSDTNLQSIQSISKERR